MTRLLNSLLFRQGLSQMPRRVHEGSQTGLATVAPRRKGRCRAHRLGDERRRADPDLARHRMISVRSPR